jgi:Nicotinic acid mononucleotide adenylyltransferase
MKLAVEDYPKFKVSDFEFSLPRPSYTINTLEKLKETYPDISFTLIIGADNWNVFNKWKDSDNIISSFNILVYPRKGFDIDITSLPQNVKISDAPIIEISSTFIRKSLKENKDVRFFLPDKVYIELKRKGIVKTGH